MEVKYDTLPERMGKEAKAYIEDRIPPCGFLSAVLCNDLNLAANRGDRNNQQALLAWGKWLNTIPMDAWGDWDSVVEWCSDKERA
jgi:hypothetical protein